MKSGHARVFTSSDLNTIKQQNKQHVQTASRIMTDFFTIEEKAGLKGKATCTRIKCQMYCRLVMHIHGKTAPNRRQFRSLPEIAHVTFQELQQAFPEEMRGIEAPWATVELASASSKGERVSGLREIDRDGAVTMSALTTANIIQGALLQKDNQNFGVVSFDEERSMATLHCTTTNKDVTRSFEELLDYAVLQRVTQACVEPSNLALCMDYVTGLEKSRVRLIVNAFHKLHAKKMKSLVKIQHQPSRTVLAVKDIKVRELVLVPATTQSGHTMEGQVMYSTSLVVGRSFVHPLTQRPVTLTLGAPRLAFPASSSVSGSCKSKPETFVIPFWIVRAAVGQGHANVKVDVMEHTFHGGTARFPVYVNDKDIPKGYRDLHLQARQAGLGVTAGACAGPAPSEVGERRVGEKVGARGRPGRASRDGRLVKDRIIVMAFSFGLSWVLHRLCNPWP